MLSQSKKQLRQLKQLRKENLIFFSAFLFAVTFVASLTPMLFCNPRFKHEIYILNISVDTYEFHDFFHASIQIFSIEFGREHDTN